MAAILLGDGRNRSCDVVCLLVTYMSPCRTRNRSMEIKNSLSLPSPPPPPPPPPRPPSVSPRSSRPRASHFKAPRRPLGLRSLNLNRAKLRPPSPSTGPENYPPLTHSSPLPTLSSPMSPLSYAQVACPRGTKRSLSDRLCLSPVDTFAKRHTSSTGTPPALTATPPSVETMSAVPLETKLPFEDFFPGTPQEMMEEVLMDGGTPETDHLVYNRRRRLFEAEGSSESILPKR